jgi:voltage-gated potassium channel
MDALFSIDDHVIVCGYGATGQAVARDLREQGVKIVVLDKSTEAVRRAEDDGHVAVVGDALAPDALKEAGVERARGVLFLLPAETDNLFAVMSARELNPAVFIIASHTSAHARSKFQRAGADRVVNPFEASGRRLGAEFMRPAVRDLMKIFAEEKVADQEVRVREVTVQPGSRLVGQSLRDADIRAKLDILIIAMRHGGEAARFSPDPTRKLAAGDVMVCMGRLVQLKKLLELAGTGAS